MDNTQNLVKQNYFQLDKIYTKISERKMTFNFKSSFRVL